MSMMMSHILKFVDFTKTQKSRCLENETLFFLQIKKFINYTSRAKNSFLAEVTFNMNCLLRKNIRKAKKIFNSFFWIIYGHRPRLNTKTGHYPYLFIDLIITDFVLIYHFSLKFTNSGKFLSSHKVSWRF